MLIHVCLQLVPDGLYALAVGTALLCHQCLQEPAVGVEPPLLVDVVGGQLTPCAQCFVVAPDGRFVVALGVVDAAVDHVQHDAAVRVLGIGIACLGKVLARSGEVAMPQVVEGVVALAVGRVLALPG